MAQIHLTSNDWAKREGRYWATFFNTLSGPRSVVMIGTQDNEGIGNIGLFNSLVHLGANPPLLGFVLRPTTAARHTYENILATGCYTVNHGIQSRIEDTHQTSAKYEAHQDEFEACGWSKSFIDGFEAPFIAEAPIQIGLRFEDEHFISQNDTRFIVGRIEHVRIDEQFIGNDGFIDTANADTLLSSGLDAYHTHKLLKRMPYAKP